MRLINDIDELLQMAGLPESASLKFVAQNKELARLGDAYLNFIFSLMLSIRDSRPSGLKVSNRVLSLAFKSAGLRPLLPKRVSRHEIGGAVEALILFAVANRIVTSREIIDSLRENDEVAALASLLSRIKERWPSRGD
ncbi:MAG: ribonuclease III family protein [Candidatus Bathyarchaeia archaeon]